MVGNLDVIARLADHQQNVPAPRGRAPSVVVCFPPPPIEQALGVDAPMRAHRRRVCEALAARVGGGDGPAPIEFPQGQGALQRSLETWRAERVERLHLVGARAQPGWARAILARWGGGLRVERDVDDEIEGALHGELTRAGVAVSNSGPAEGPSFAVDRGRTSGCWQGFVPTAALFANQHALRDAWVWHWTERGHAGAIRDALLGHDPALEVALCEPRKRENWGRPVAVAITGIDGSGKSTQVAALADSLTAAGVRVRVIKLYRQGAFLELANELSGRTRGGAALGAFRTSRVVKLVDSLRVWRDEVLAVASASDLVLFDRYLETHEAAAGAQLGWDLAEHPALAVFPRVDAEFLLRLDPAEAIARVSQRGEARSADEHLTGLLGYAESFDRIGARDGFITLDARADRDENARAILAAVEPLLAHDAPRVRLAEAGPQPRLRTGGDGLHVGGAVDDGAPGDDVCDLAARVRDARPEVSAAFPEAFWLEAYAAQVLLDLRASGASGAEVAWWPAALARAPEFADLVTLAELERMTLALAPVRRVTLGGGAAPARLQALVGDRAGRLALMYRRGLEAHAIEQGWRVEH